MPGTPRDIAYLESKFETGDIPTQQDFYDLFQSFVHYLKVVQTEGSSTSNIMSQKAVTDALAALQSAITSVGELVGEHDASTGLPTTGSGEADAIDKGDYWFITTPGTIAGLGDLAVGDVLFAKVAGADEASEFFYLPFASLGGLMPNQVNPITAKTTFTHTTGTEVSIDGEEIQIKTAHPAYEDLFENTDVEIQWFYNGGRVYVKQTGSTPVKLSHYRTVFSGAYNPDTNPYLLTGTFNLDASYQDIGSTASLLGVDNRTWALQPVDDELKLISFFNGVPPLESSPPPASPTSVSAADNPVDFYSDLSSFLDVFAKERLMVVNREGIVIDGVEIQENKVTANELVTTIFSFLGTAFDIDFIKAGADRMELRGGGETGFILTRIFTEYLGTLLGELVIQAGDGLDTYAALVLRAESPGGVRIQADGVSIPGDGANPLGINSDGQVVTLDPVLAGFAIAATYVDITELLDNQGSQLESAWYLVQDASDDPTVNSGWAIYHKLADSTADLADYQKIAEQESLDVVINDSSTTTKGIIELADSAEAQAGTDIARAMTPALVAANTRPGDQGGTDIAFNYPSTYGRTTPETGNITADYTNAIIGQVAKIYHEHSSAPTFPAGWKNIGISEYVPGELNIIIAEYVRASGDRVEYFILQPNATKEAVILKKTGKLTVAQIETLGTGGGIDIVPAPGAGKAIQFHNAFLKYPYQTTPYGSTHDELRFEVGLSTLTDNFLLLSLTTTSWAHVPMKMNAGMTTYENLPLKLKCPTGNPTGGDSELHYTVFYSIVNTEHA